MGVGVMRNKKLKLRELNDSFTLSCVGDWDTLKVRVEESTCLSHTGLYDKTN